MAQLRFKEISYEQLKNLGNFQNEKISATVIVEENQDPLAVLNDLREWVHKELNLRTTVKELKEQKNYLEKEIARLNGELNLLHARFQKIASLVAKSEFN